MGEQRKSISEAYSETAYPLIGHSRRNLEVLLEAFRDVDGSQMGIHTAKAPSLRSFRHAWQTFWARNRLSFSERNHGAADCFADLVR